MASQPPPPPPPARSSCAVCLENDSQECSKILMDGKAGPLHRKASLWRGGEAEPRGTGGWRGWEWGWRGRGEGGRKGACLGRQRPQDSGCGPAQSPPPHSAGSHSCARPPSPTPCMTVSPQGWAPDQTLGSAHEGPEGGALHPFFVLFQSVSGWDECWGVRGRGVLCMYACACVHVLPAVPGLARGSRWEDEGDSSLSPAQPIVRWRQHLQGPGVLLWVHRLRPVRPLGGCRACWRSRHGAQSGLGRAQRAQAGVGSGGWGRGPCREWLGAAGGSANHTHAASWACRREGIAPCPPAQPSISVCALAGCGGPGHRVCWPSQDSVRVCKGSRDVGFPRGLLDVQLWPTV